MARLENHHQIRAMAMLRSPLPLLTIGFAILTDRFGFPAAARGMLDRASGRWPAWRQLLVSQAAFLAERRGDFDTAVRLLVQAGPPATEPGYYFAELGHLQERQGAVSEAWQSYRLALEARQGLSADFIEWLTQKRAVVQETKRSTHGTDGASRKPGI